MAPLTRTTLQKLRAEKKESIRRTDSTIFVGMGSCGIAAGAKETLATIQSQIETLGLAGIVVKPTGCIGPCYAEPMVEVSIPGMPETLYGRVTPEIAKKIVDQHIVRHQLVNEYVYDKPAQDIFK